MTCEHLHVGEQCVTICHPERNYARLVRHCPTCARRRRFVGLVAEWYPTVWTCCACGDSWSEGYRMERPFARNWRADACTRARRAWAEGTTLRAALQRAISGESL